MVDVQCGGPLPVDVDYLKKNDLEAIKLLEQLNTVKFMEEGVPFLTGWE